MEPRESTRHDKAYVKFKSNPVHGDEARMGWRGGGGECLTGRGHSWPCGRRVYMCTHSRFMH